MKSITTENGVTFNVRIVRKGERYGLEDCLVHDHDGSPAAESLVEFYDAAYTERSFAGRGFFVARYYAYTLLSGRLGGLALMGDEPRYDVGETAMGGVRRWVEAELARDQHEILDGGR